MKKALYLGSLAAVLVLIISLNLYFIKIQAATLNFSWPDILSGIILGFLCWTSEEWSAQHDVYKKTEKVWIGDSFMRPPQRDYGFDPLTIIFSFLGITLVFATPAFKNWNYFLAMLGDSSIDLIAEFSPFIFAIIGLTSGLLAGLCSGDYSENYKKRRLLHILGTNTIISLFIFIWMTIIFKQLVFLEMILFNVNYFLFLILGMLIIVRPITQKSQEIKAI